MTNRKNIYLPDHILDLLKGRDSLSGRVTTVLDRYHEMLRRMRIEKRFTGAEFNLIRDACLSWRAEPAAAVFGGVALEVEDSLADGLAEKWNVDVSVLLAKLKALSSAEEVALVEAIEKQRAATE